MLLTGVEVRVLQVHPTRRCNLRCLHCYSSSGPEERGELDATLLRTAIADASELGYNMLSVSGGEPFLYASLRELLDEAHQNRCLTGVVTNGMFLNERKLEELRGSADLIAISLDGIPKSHNRLRANNRAFETMVEHLPALRRSGIPFAFIFTLTRINLNELEWVADFAVEQGARFLQVHPLEDAGRAMLTMSNAEPCDEDAARAWLVVERLRQIYQGRLAIHLDLLDLDSLSLQCSDWTQSWLNVERATRRFGWLLSPLVVETDGVVVPLRYGFPRHFALGNLREFRLAELVRTWLGNSGQKFQAMCARSMETAHRQEWPFANIYELIAKSAEAASVSARSI